MVQSQLAVCRFLKEQKKQSNNPQLPSLQLTQQDGQDGITIPSASNPERLWIWRSDIQKFPKGASTVCAGRKWEPTSKSCLPMLVCGATKRRRLTSQSDFHTCGIRTLISYQMVNVLLTPLEAGVVDLHTCSNSPQTCRSYFRFLHSLRSGSADTFPPSRRNTTSQRAPHSDRSPWADDKRPGAPQVHLLRTAG